MSAFSSFFAFFARIFLAVLFVVFDVDLAFLLPWAMTRGALTLTAMVAMTVFLLLMLMMLGYFWRKGALECR